MVKIDLRTSGVSLHFKKYKANSGEINGLQRHNERQPGGRHGNKNIDDTRTKDNIFLIEDDRKLNKRIEDTIVENRDGGLKGVRKNAVRMVEGTVQLSGKALDQPEERQIELLKDSFEYLQDTFGKENVVSAVIHLDETHPHLHFDFVPIEDGRLTAKTIISPNRLRKYQSDFLKHLQDDNPDLNFQRSNGQYNGLPQEIFERLKDEQKRIEKEQDDREEELADREEAVTRKESDLSGLEAKEKSLNFREKLVNCDKKKNQRDKEKNQKDSDKLKKKKKELDDREKNVADKEEKVKTLYQNKEKELSDREKNVADKEEKVKTLYQNKEKELSDREHNVERREKASDGREKGLDDEVAQRTAERFAEATGMMTEAKRLKREADEKDKKADKKLADAEKKDNDADQKLSRINNVWNNIQQALNRIVERIKHGDLKPEEVEDTIEKYNPVTEDNVDDVMLDMNDLVDDNQINL